MPRVSFTANLRRHLPVEDLRVEGNTVRQCLDHVFSGHGQLRSYILDDQGRARRHINIFVDSQRIRDRDKLSDPVAEEQVIHIIQALSGGTDAGLYRDS